MRIAALDLPKREKRPMFRFGIAALAGVLVIGAVGAGLTAASAATVAHVQNKPTKGEQSLANHVPSSFANTCAGVTASMKKTYAKTYPKVKKQTNSIVAAVSCTPTGTAVPELVVYTQWKNLADMNAYYNATVAGYGIQPETRAAAPAVCPLESTSTAGTTVVRVVGRVVCQPSVAKNPAEIVWTTNPLKILGDAFVTTDPDGSLLNTWWKADSGPSQ
jgi:hypothetical protein